MERKNILFAHIDEDNTESPRACQIIALRLADVGFAIPEDIEEAIIGSAERGRGVLKGLINEVNKSFKDENISNFTIRMNFLRLASQIAFSHGVNGPEACLRRMDNLYAALKSDDITEEGVGFTE